MLLAQMSEFLRYDMLEKEAMCKEGISKICAFTFSYSDKLFRIPGASQGWDGRARRNFNSTIKHKKLVTFIEVGNKNEITNKKNDLESFKGRQGTHRVNTYTYLLCL